jgi:hypothetical protein
MKAEHVVWRRKPAKAMTLQAGCSSHYSMLSCNILPSPSLL